MTEAKSLTITIDAARRVSGLMIAQADARALFVFAHGAGAGMTHPGMALVAEALSARRIATLRFQFPYMEAGSKRPDAPKLAHAAVRAAVREAARLKPNLPLFAGGRSFGGRMISQAQAIEALPGVRGLIFLGFPLHPAGKPATDRAAHLADVRVPMLFLQGARDALAEPALLKPVIAGLGKQATFVSYEGADHSFRVPRKLAAPGGMEAALAEAAAAWMADRLA